jgi:hypothetical protein
MRGLSGCVCLSGFFSCARRILWRRRRRWRAMRRWRMRFVFLAWAYVWLRRADDWRFRQARDVVESEDRAEKRVMMCGAEEFAAASRARARQPGCAARVERYDGDAEQRHGVRVPIFSRGTACRARRKNLALSRHLWRLTIRGRRMVAHGAMMARGCLWRVRARHAVPLLGKCLMRKERCGRCAPSDCERGALLRWHRRHFHVRLPAGPVLLNC